VRLLISSGFRWMNSAYNDLTYYNPLSNTIFEVFRHALSFIGKSSGYRDIFQREPPSAVLLVMWHPLNFLLARQIKSLFPDVPILAWLHEPYKDTKIIYGYKALIILLVEWFQTISLRYVDVVILHSQRALRLFKEKYPHFPNRTYMVPLQFQDHKKEIEPSRQYISFLGRAELAKGIDVFFSLVEESAITNPEWTFQIVTSSNIERYLEKLSPVARRKLFVVNDIHISDEDLRVAAGKSIAILSLYKETMQSGIIPLAFMKGTPIIGTNIEGITEWIRDKETGIRVSSNPSIEEIKSAIGYIRNNFYQMTGRCRIEYLEIFDDRNWDRDYKWLKKLLSSHNKTSENL
jgi:glycosyltransferase involved in cell wall biosynthesis